MTKTKKIRIGKNNKKILIIGGAIILVIAIVVGILLATGVFSSKEDNSKPNTNSGEPTGVEEKKLQIVDENSTSRPYAIMINNINVARPLQSGLQDAYIIYEIIVEGGITRYMALFMDQDTERIGSIRKLNAW